MPVVAKRKGSDLPVLKALEGDTITLSCDRGLVTSDTLYAIKWYKDEKEFYRNYPKKVDDPVKVFPIEGFTLQVSKGFSSVSSNIIWITMNVYYVRHIWIDATPYAMGSGSTKCEFERIWKIYMHGCRLPKIQNNLQINYGGSNR